MIYNMQVPGQAFKGDSYSTFLLELKKKRLWLTVQEDDSLNKHQQLSCIVNNFPLHCQFNMAYLTHTVY